MRRDSGPARYLLAELRALGEDVSARQLERLGEFGLPGPAGETDETALLERVREALRLVEEHGSGDRAAIVMFLRGYDFAPDRLVKAYMTYFERVEAWIEKHGGARRGYQAAERIAVKLAAQTAKSAEDRPLRERVKRLRTGRQPFMTMKQWLTSIYTDAVLILTDGSSSSDQALRELLEATDVATITRESVPGRPPPVPVLPVDSIKEMLGMVRLGRQAVLVATATYGQLCAAREDMVALVKFARVFAPVAQRAFGMRIAYGFGGIAQLPELACGLLIPSMVLMRQICRSQLDELRQVMDLEQPRFEAMNELLDEIPDRFYPAAHTADHMEDLSPEDRAELVAIINSFESRNPEKFACIAADVKRLPAVKYAV